MSSYKSPFKFFDYEIFKLCEPLILKFLSKTSFEKSIDYLFVYWKYSKTENKQFIEIIKFDIYRKA
jgi:hypothetical protein